jgi:hypothetical protein
MRKFFVIALLATCVRVHAAAAPVQLVLRDGVVWLVARDASLGQIFEEWARVGQTRVVNADRLTERLSIELNGIPEGQALDTLLRSVGGFVAVQRSALAAPPTATQSRFAQIVIMPGREKVVQTASVSASAPIAPTMFQQAPPTAVQVAPGVQRLLGPDGQPVPDDQEDGPVAIVPRPPVPSLPPGFATPSQARPAVPPPAQTGPIGSPVPGVVPGQPTNSATPRRPPGV